MARAKRPVTIAGIEFDALISEEHGYEATVPEYAVESGFSVSDAIIHGAETLNMVLYVTDTPVTWRNHSGRGRVEQVTKRLEELYYAAEPVTIVTSDATYTSMAIENLTIQQERRGRLCPRDPDFVPQDSHYDGANDDHPRQLRQEWCDRRFCRHGQHVQREQRLWLWLWRLRFGFWLWQRLGQQQVEHPLWCRKVNRPDFVRRETRWNIRSSKSLTSTTA